MCELPVCLVIGIGFKDSNVIVKGLLGVDELPAASNSMKTMSCHTWQVDNKYYSACVQINETSSTSLIDKNLANQTEATILYFDSQKENDLKSIEEVWLPLLESLDSLDIKILVCDTCSPEENQTGISKLEALKWCVKYGFELVELDSCETPDPDDDFPETLGMQRIIQALHAHSWSNMELKDQGERKKHDTFSETVRKKALQDQQQDEALFKFSNSGNSDNPAADGIDSFEELFQAMSMMKSQAGALQGAERKAYAEKITMAFWRAIEGDAEEIAGLDSSGGEE